MTVRELLQPLLLGTHCKYRLNMPHVKYTYSFNGHFSSNNKSANCRADLPSQNQGLFISFLTPSHEVFLKLESRLINLHINTITFIYTFTQKKKKRFKKLFIIIVPQLTEAIMDTLSFFHSTLQPMQ